MEFLIMLDILLTFLLELELEIFCQGRFQNLTPLKPISFFFFC